MTLHGAHKKIQLLSRVCLGLWALAIVALSLLRHPPGARLIAELPYRDAMGHALAYAVLALLITWNAAGWSWRVRLAAAAVAAGLFGLVVELVQPLVGRSFDPKDLIANALGIGAGLVAAVLAGVLVRTLWGPAGDEIHATEQ